MPINIAIIVLINACVSYYPFSYFIILKITNKIMEIKNNPISNKVIRENVYKFFKTLSLS